MPAKMEIPLGQLENQRLEFKSAKALADPEKIAREVVAMLNADGGEVWIGLREEGGRAMEMEPIPDAESAKFRLVDFLLDTMDPSPREDEVEVEVVPLPGSENGEDNLLRIRVTSSRDRMPYAVLRRSAWSFPRRVGARLMPMTREEIRRAMKGGPAEATDTARSRLLSWRKDWRRGGRSGLWLGLWPTPEPVLDPQADLFQELAVSPSASGNRRSGWTFARSFHSPELTAKSIRWGGLGADREYEVRVEIRDDGRAAFFASFAALSREKNEEIWPFALLEYPTSGLRMVARVYQELAPGVNQVLADLSLFNVDKWMLRASSPNSIRFDTQPARSLQEGQDVLFEHPLSFSRQEVVEEPDRCAYRLLRRVYQAFGWREDDIPAEYDRHAGRLILRE